MHPNHSFRQTSRSENIAFARDRGFGILAAASKRDPLASHIPFLLSEDGEVVEFHLVRSNPIARMPDVPIHARLVVHGPHSYVSPDWYGIENQVPTWNYVAVHLTGEVEPLSADKLRDILERQSAYHESGLAPKPPWTVEKMDPDVLNKLMRQIVPYQMKVSDIQGTWKLNQNKPVSARMQAADEVRKYGQGQEMELLSSFMRQPPQ
ncbi:MAG: FMN-binding negative transcriptional regulator [Roseovarius sp.]|nr:FMN-binding negative transcriptional regulator [Roseovarius sp.]